MLTTADIESFLHDRLDDEAIRGGRHHVQLGEVRMIKINGSSILGIVEGSRVQVHFGADEVNVSKDCSCPTKKCSHLGGLLYKFTERKDSNFTNKAGYWRKIIGEMTEDTKDEFILEHVRRNKAIAYDLRAVNLSREGLYADERAREILEELKAPIVKSTRKPTSLQVNILTQMTRTSIKSVDRLVQEGFNLQGISVLLLLADTLQYVYFRLNRNSHTIHQLLVKLDERTSDLLPVIRAPEAQYNVIALWKDGTTKSYYTPLSKESIMRFVHALGSEDLRQMILTHIEKRICGSSGYVRSVWSEAWVEAILTLPEVRPGIHLSQLQEFQRDTFWQRLTESTPWPHLLSLIDPELNHLPVKHVTRALQYFCAHELVDYIILLLEQYPSLVFASDNKELACQLYPRLHGFNRVQFPQLISVLVRTQREEWVLDFIDESESLTATLPLLSVLSSENIEHIGEAIVEQVHAYLNTHIGVKSEQSMAVLLEVLENKGNRKLKKTVKEVLKNSFGYRNDIYNVLSNI